MKIVWIGGDADWTVYNSGAANLEYLFMKYLIEQEEVDRIDFIDLPFPDPRTHQYPSEFREKNGIHIYLPRYKIRYKPILQHLRQGLHLKGKIQLNILKIILWFKFRGLIDLAKLEGKKVGTITASPMYLSIVEPAFSQLHQQMKKYIQKLDPDVLHVLMEIFAPVAALLKRENDVPNVICAMEDWGRQLQQLNPGGIQYAAIESCYNLSKWSADHTDEFDEIFPVSTSIRDYLGNVGYPHAKIEKVLPAPLDPTIMKPVDQAKARARLDLPSKKRILLTVGRFMERKKYEDLIEILPRLPENVILYMKVCTSSSDTAKYEEEEIFKRKLREKKVKDRVIIDNQQLPYEDMNYVYSASDIVVLPFIGEAFGMSASEAMACGKPIVLYDSGNFPTFIDGNGFLIPPSDLEKLKEKILYLLDNPSIAEEMGLKGKELAVKYDIRTLGAQLLETYLEISKK
ncbi:MAG: glycosyltransferase family 4 protein [Candidatus Helarchaeota archaeon]